ncbi:MAG: hypothetical protein AAFR97_04985, partial [Bacteroidota bacterium]
PGTFTSSGDVEIGGLCAGTYTDITIIGVHTGCSDIWPEDIVITEPDDFTVEVPDVTVCEFEDASFTATVNPPGSYSFSWNTGDNGP